MRVTKKNLKVYFPELDVMTRNHVYRIVRDWTDPDEVMEELDGILGGFGVEPIRGEFHDNFWGDVEALYVNMGATYDNTILFDVRNSSFSITTVGDWAERHLSRVR